MRRLLFGGLTLFAAIALAACGGAASPAASSAPPAASVPAASEPAASEPAASEPAASEPAGAACESSTDAGTVDTSIADFAFAQPVTAAVGDVVAWKNDDSAPHSVVLDDGSCETATIEPAASASLTFNSAGTFAFHCGIHPNMKGTIEVTG